MSLFDVLKYPISSPPTYTELKSLPEEIYNKWVREVMGGGDPAVQAARLLMLHRSFLLTKNSLYDYSDYIEKLRIMIREYQE